MRVAPAIVNLKNLEYMGAGTGMTLVTIPWADLYNALERGVVDGCWSIWSSMVEERHYEVLKYYTALDWLWGTNNVVVNKEIWEELPQDIQEALMKAGKYTELVEFETHRRADYDFIKIIKDGGVEIYYPTPEERTLFREKANVPLQWENFAKPWIEENYPGQNMTQTAMDELKLIRESY
jgi:C4-dicarboxylate-binding protein DctP